MTRNENGRRRQEDAEEQKKNKRKRRKRPGQESNVWDGRKVEKRLGNRKGKRKLK